MDGLVHIETEQLKIVPFKEAYLTDRYVGWLNDPEVVKYSEQRHQYHSLESCRAYFLMIESSANIFLAICDKLTGLHIGNVSVNMDMNNGIADISIMIGDRDFWGKGLGSEAFTAVVGNLLERGDVRKVTAGTMAANKPMLKAMALAGMEEEARRGSHYLLNGTPVDMVYFSRWRNNDDI